VSQPHVLGALVALTIAVEEVLGGVDEEGATADRGRRAAFEAGLCGEIRGGLVDRPQLPAALFAERDQHVVTDLGAGGSDRGGDRR
jgi:hypothetical protein